jgi:hypothetical protein
MFAGYFVASAGAIWATFGLALPPEVRLYMMGLIGLTVFGVFGAFTFYLPELFPMRLRGTGAGFCYNTGRFVTALFPFGVSLVARSGENPLLIIRWAAFVPLIGVALVLLNVVVETKDEAI